MVLEAKKFLRLMITIYIEFSRPMDYSADTSDNADMLTSFLNSHLSELENKIK